MEKLVKKYSLIFKLFCYIPSALTAYLPLAYVLKSEHYTINQLNQNWVPIVK